MKKAWIPITIVAFALSPASIMADAGPSSVQDEANVAYEVRSTDDHDTSDEATSSQEENTSASSTDNSNDQQMQQSDERTVKYVSEPSDDVKYSEAKTRYWKNLALAGIAIVIAIVAIVLVSSNDGHRSHDHKHSH